MILKLKEFSGFNLISSSSDASFRLKRNHAHTYILTRYVFIIFGFYFYLMVSIEGFCMLLSLFLSLSLSLSNIILSSPFRVLYSHMQWKVHLVTVYIVREFYCGAWNTIWYSTSYSTHNDKGQKWIIDITMVHTQKEISSRQ